MLDTTMPNNFVTNPKGNAPMPARPRSFVEVPPEMSRQKPYDGLEANAKEMPANAGRTAADVAQNNPTQDAGNPIGTFPLGRNRSPFSLK